MYLQGTAIWHPRCGPGPSENGTTIFNGGTTGDVDRISNSAMSEIQVSQLIYFLSITKFCLINHMFIIEHLSPDFLQYKNDFFIQNYDFHFVVMIYVFTVFITFTYT